MVAIYWTAKSSNAKTGPIPVTTTEASSCPASCPFKGNGCYAEAGPLAILWRGLPSNPKRVGWDALCDNVAALPDGQLWRHNQAGDLPQDGQGRIDQGAVMALADANKGRRGFTYTHHDMGWYVNRVTVAVANERGFTVNVSANNLEDADRLSDMKVGPVVVVVPVDAPRTMVTPAGRKVATCPATYRDDVSCASCGLCAVRDRKVIVAFPAHGASKRKAEAASLNA
jgi:hypothetical protein